VTNYNFICLVRSSLLMPSGFHSFIVHSLLTLPGIQSPWLRHLGLGVMSNISQEFVASIAQALNASQVPCILWGHILLIVHGVPTILGVSISARSRDPVFELTRC